MLVFGNAVGEAVIFYDPNDVTAKIRAIFADPTILKVQTGIEADIVLLPFRVFGLVDSGCFVPLFDSSIWNFLCRTCTNSFTRMVLFGLNGRFARQCGSTKTKCST